VTPPRGTLVVFSVMPGLVPGINVFMAYYVKKRRDGRA
jgi:hypothetical protein